MIETVGVVLQIGDVINLGLPSLLLLAGLALVVMEALAPGAHFMVVGVALLAAGIVGLGAASAGVPVLAGPLALALMVLVFGAVTFFAYREFDVYGGGSRGSTSDSASLKSQSGRVTERVTATGGEVKLENGGFNPYYRARSMDGEIAEGEEVVVVDPGGGNVLTVMSLEGTSEDAIDRELARDRDAKSEPEPEPEPEREREPERETETG
jgi:membrane protein implicated in regulation of membrane protease activity